MLVDAGQDFKAAVKHQLGLRIALLDPVHQRYQPCFLLGTRFGRFSKLLVGVQRVKKEGAVACIPQRRYHAVCKKLGPCRAGLVYEQAAPVLVFALDPGFGDLRHIGPVGVHFAY